MAATIEREAYYISGHGLSTEGSFRVPFGQTIVVLARESEVTTGAMFDQFCNLPATVLKNPNLPEHRAILVDTFGSLAFYNAGDICPNFNYKFPSCYNDFSCDWIGSGIINIDKIREFCSNDLTKIFINHVVPFNESYPDRIENSHQLPEIFANYFFLNSSYPTVDRVLEIMQTIPQQTYDIIFSKYNSTENLIDATKTLINLVFYVLQLKDK